jgi:hypothetical protein
VKKSNCEHPKDLSRMTSMGLRKTIDCGALLPPRHRIHTIKLKDLPIIEANMRAMGFMGKTQSTHGTRTRLCG